MTPSGTTVVEVLIAHQSTQIEAGLARKVEVEIRGIAVGQWANVLAQTPLGATLTATGFFAAKSQRSKQPILHLTNIEFSDKPMTEGETAPSLFNKG